MAYKIMRPERAAQKLLVKINLVDHNRVSLECMARLAKEKKNSMRNRGQRNKLGGEWAESYASTFRTVYRSGMKPDEAYRLVKKVLRGRG